MTNYFSPVGSVVDHQALLIEKTLKSENVEIKFDRSEIIQKMLLI